MVFDTVIRVVCHASTIPYYRDYNIRWVRSSSDLLDDGDSLPSQDIMCSIRGMMGACMELGSVQLADDIHLPASSDRIRRVGMQHAYGF